MTEAISKKHFKPRAGVTSKLTRRKPAKAKALPETRKQTLAESSLLSWRLAVTNSKEPAISVLSSPEMTEMEMRIVREGITSEVFYGVATEAGIPVAELAQALGMNERTIQRKKKAGERLDADMSERAFRAMKAWTMAKDTLGSVEQAREWLTSSIRSLGGATPLSLLGTSAGERMVVNTLGAIEYGIYL